jgi:hypothetical protein
MENCVFFRKEMGILLRHPATFICSCLHVRGVKNVKKGERIASIINTYKNNNPPRKEAQCSYCFLNIYFSNEFSDLLNSIGNTAPCAVLDTCKAANDKGFWKNSSNLYSKVLFTKDTVFMFEVINPGKIGQHNWKTLCSIWKAANGEYTAVLHRYTELGTHDDNFYNFCVGQKDTYFIHLILADKPNFNETVNADLPELCNVSSSTYSSTVNPIAVMTKNY